MAEDVDERLRDGADHPRGLVGAAAQRGVRRRDHELEPAELVGLHVNPAVGADVGFDALEQPESSAVPLVELIDGGVLPRHGLHAHPAGDGQAVAMIRDAGARPAQGTGCFDDTLERLTPVTPRRVHLEVAAVIRQRDQPMSRRLQHSLRGRLTDEVAAQRSARRDRLRLPTLMYGSVHRGRAARIQVLEDDALARGPHVRNLREFRPVSECGQRLRQSQNRVSRALVGEGPRSVLKRRKVQQQPCDGGVDVVIDCGCRVRRRD